MIIKKYTGKTENEAVETARRELGDGVVVMNVKNVKKKGMLGSLKTRMVEVTVALEEENEKFVPVREPQKEAVPQQVQTRPNPTGIFADNQNTQNLEMKLDSLQSLLMSQIQNKDNKDRESQEPETETTSRASDHEKEKEPEEEQDSEMMKFMRLLYNTMIDNEVDEKYANQIMEEIERLNKPNMPFDYTLANTYQKMILKFGRTSGVLPATKGPRTVLFIGPTGVGKTTTIAKIASAFAVEKKKRVALLTADTYRIAAAEQLRTYANILEVPFRVIYSDDEMKTAVRDFQDYDYIFVDTSGHSDKNAEQVEKIKSLLKCVDEVSQKQVFLVLSATTKYKDLLRIVDSYRSITDYQLIFTKLDETTSLGNLMNLRLYTDASVAYVTLGQNVPDDIEMFNPQKTVKQLLGGKNK